MLHKNLKRALEKKGYTIKKNDIFYSTTNKNNVISWHAREEEENPSAKIVHIQRLTNKSDCQSDYFPGFFCRTIKDAVTSFENY